MERAGQDRLKALLQEEKSRRAGRDAREQLKSSFGAFIRAAWPVVEPAKPLIDNWHIDALADHLQAVADGSIRFLMINIGPGYAKSVIASVMFSGWLWTRTPETRIIAATYASTLTVRDSIRTRDLIQSPWYQEVFNPPWSVARVTKEVDYRKPDPEGGWRLVKENEDWLSNSRSGERRALSVGGKATGFRGDGQIFDDLLNATDKHSKSARQNARDWAISTMSSRFNDMRNGWRVVIGQRLHEDDPYGAMLATGDYEHLCLPSEFEPERRAKTSIGWQDPRTQKGELLFPELFTEAVLAKAKRDLGSYDYAGQHQQSPAPAEGGLFKRDWWQYYDVAPSLEVIVISVDCTFKDKPESDYVSIQVWGFVGPRSYLLDRLHDQMGFTATKQAIIAMVQRWEPHAVLIEDKANGTAVIEELGRTIQGVIAIEPEGGKEARAWATQPDVEAGVVFLPNAPWAQEVVNEAASFPNGAHDDDVDSMTQALNWRRKRWLSFGLIDAYRNLQTKAEEIMAKGNRKPSNTELLEKARGGKTASAPAKSEKALPLAGQVDKIARPEAAKVDVPDNVERCPDCSGTFIQRTPAGRRCGSCGKMLQNNGVKPPVIDALVRK